MAVAQVAAAFRLQGLDYTWTAGTVEPPELPEPEVEYRQRCLLR
jgi:hypothetical protein